MLVSGGGAGEREFMHCYAPNFEELEEANWFGPISLSVYFSPTSPPPKKVFFFRFGVFVNHFPLPLPSPPALPPKKIF